MSAQSPVPFQSPPPACPKCSNTTSIGQQYTKAGIAWEGAPELLMLTCPVCQYGGTDYTFTMLVENQG